MATSDSELQTHSYRYIFHHLSLRHRCTQTETLPGSGQTSAVPCQALKTSRQDGHTMVNMSIQYSIYGTHMLKYYAGYAGNR